MYSGTNVISVTSIDTHQTSTWTIERIVKYINHYRGADPIEYNHANWQTGWNKHIQGNGFFIEPTLLIAKVA